MIASRPVASLIRLQTATRKISGLSRMRRMESVREGSFLTIAIA